MKARKLPPRGSFASERRAADHHEQGNEATVTVHLGRLAASRTTRPENAGLSGLRRGTGTVALIR
jgi:hypothetical protein